MLVDAQCEQASCLCTSKHWLPDKKHGSEHSDNLFQGLSSLVWSNLTRRLED